MNTNRLLKNSLNVQIQNDYHLGYKLDHDLAALKNLEVLAVLMNAKGNFFLAHLVTNKTVSLGCCHQHGPRAKHAIEWTYDMNKDAVGFLGQPIKLSWAGVYERNPFITWRFKTVLAKDAIFTFSWQQ